MDFDFGSLLAFIIFGVTIGVVYGIVALGISLIYSGLDIVHFAHGEIYMFGAFLGLVLSQQIGIPYPGAMIGAMILAAFSVCSLSGFSIGVSRDQAVGTPSLEWG